MWSPALVRVKRGRRFPEVLKRALDNGKILFPVDARKPVSADFDCRVQFSFLAECHTGDAQIEGLLLHCARSESCVRDSPAERIS
jgi:hypothetical protein